MQLEILAKELLCKPLEVLERKYGMAESDLKELIYRTPKLRKAYNSRHRKENMLALKNKCAYEFNKDGCTLLAGSVIKQAIKDRDFYFFESGKYIFWQNLLSNGYTADDYCRLIMETTSVTR